MQPRTDLAVESSGVKGGRLKAIFQTVKKYGDVEIVKIEIKNDEEAKILNRPVGTYITISSKNMLMPEKFCDVEYVLKKELQPFVQNKNSILVVGLGNKNICCDSLGPVVAGKVVATRHIKTQLAENFNVKKIASVSVISPGVLGQTGIETTEIVKALVEKTKPELVVVVDALAAGSINRLGTTIQLTDSGIAPGSGINSSRVELSSRVLKVPVLAIGVPTVVDLQSISLQSKYMETDSEIFMVTPRNIDEIVQNAGSLISQALNGVVLPMFSKQELEVLKC